MIGLMVVSALVAVTMGADPRHCCSWEDRQTVQEQWNSIWNTPDSAAVKITLGRALFDRFIAEDPDVTSVFERVNVANRDSGEFNAHMFRVLGGLDILINLLDDPEALRSEAQHLQKQHGYRDGVTRQRLRNFLEIILDGLPQVLSDFNRDAWSSCFGSFFTFIGASS